MQSYMWLASIFGPLLLILGVWGLFYRENMIKVFAAIKASPGMLYVLAILNLWFGLLIINCYNTWTADLLFLVPLLGWAFLLHGLACLFLPQLVLKAHHRGKNMNVSIRAIVSLVWGILLCWLAFFMY